MTARRITFWVSVALAIIAIAPAVAFAAGLGFNALWGCDIRDEGGHVYGDCAEWQSSIVYSLLLMPWFLLVTLPFAGIPAILALVVSLALYVVHRVKRKR